MCTYLCQFLYHSYLPALHERFYVYHSYSARYMQLWSLQVVKFQLKRSKIFSISRLLNLSHLGPVLLHFFLHSQEKQTSYPSLILYIVNEDLHRYEGLSKSSQTVFMKLKPLSGTSIKFYLSMIFLGRYRTNKDIYLFF